MSKFIELCRTALRDEIARHFNENCKGLRLPEPFYTDDDVRIDRLVYDEELGVMFEGVFEHEPSWYELMVLSTDDLGDLAEAVAGRSIIDNSEYEAYLNGDA